MFPIRRRSLLRPQVPVHQAPPTAGLVGSLNSCRRRTPRSIPQLLPPSDTSIHPAAPTATGSIHAAPAAAGYPRPELEPCRIMAKVTDVFLVRPQRTSPSSPSSMSSASSSTSRREPRRRTPLGESPVHLDIFPFPLMLWVLSPSSDTIRGCAVEQLSLSRCSLCLRLLHLLQAHSSTPAHSPTLGLLDVRGNQQ